MTDQGAHQQRENDLAKVKRTQMLLSQMELDSQVRSDSIHDFKAYLESQILKINEGDTLLSPKIALQETEVSQENFETAYKEMSSYIDNGMSGFLKFWSKNCLDNFLEKLIINCSDSTYLDTLSSGLFELYIENYSLNPKQLNIILTAYIKGGLHGYNFSSHKCLQSEVKKMETTNEGFSENTKKLATVIDTLSSQLLGLHQKFDNSIWRSEKILLAEKIIVKQTSDKPLKIITSFSIKGENVTITRNDYQDKDQYTISFNPMGWTPQEIKVYHKMLKGLKDLSTAPIYLKLITGEIYHANHCFLLESTVRDFWEPIMKVRIP